ncbi:MAG: acyl-CoA thioesterase [Halieaceae bacterium]|nr:acyl-CoA thioesterase [Halieaceae bacterium]
MLPFSITISPRSYETDALGHINNNAISAWLEVVRVSYLETLVPEDGAGGMNWVLASLHIDFLAETFYGADVVVRITGVTLGNSSVSFDCDMTQRDRTTVKGRAVMVFLDSQAKKPSPLPQALRAQLLREKGNLKG